MATFEIDHEQWKGFFDSFSRNHEGWRITVELLGQLGDQIEIQDMPLCGISVEEDGNCRLQIDVEDGSQRKLTHVIESPNHVWLKQAEEGGLDEVLEIEARDAVTLLHLRNAGSP